MPLTEAEKARVQRAENAAASEGTNKFLVRAPDTRHKLGAFSIACIVLNRAIG